MKTLDIDTAAAAFFALFREHPELRSAQLSADATVEPQAVAVLLRISQGDWAAWSAAPKPVINVAGTLVADFFSKLVMRHPSFVDRRWKVQSSSKPQQALEVIAIELARSHPGQSRPH